MTREEARIVVVLVGLVLLGLGGGIAAGGSGWGGFLIFVGLLWLVGGGVVTGGGRDAE